MESVLCEICGEEIDENGNCGCEDSLLDTEN